jgi:cell division ATPase FtsA
MRNRIQIAFDLGSHSIKSAAGRILPNGKIEVLSIGEIQSKSIDCGDIVDKDLLLTHLEILVEKMEKDAKIILMKMHGYQYLGEELSQLIHQPEFVLEKIQISK